MKHSEQINELAAALAKAQGEMKGAEKDSRNPHLSNKYASLSAIIEAARKPLSDNGLAFSQLIGETEGGVVLETLLMHSSGQWLMGDPVTITTLGNKGINEAQALGSGLTYFKRYTLAAMLGISVADEDDDGNSAQVQVGRQQIRRQEQVALPSKQEQPKTNGQKTFTDFLAKLKADFSLDEATAKSLLKEELGYTGYKPEKFQEMYDSVKAIVPKGEVSQDSLGFEADEPQGVNNYSVED